ncbi:hypothetical protein C8F04DRAFT_1174106 [Mycena alexandri]|uniref:Uncharacterized protein n=1 Tax=Mycena alexandri TaxID=1745969 RepID=A0AAD6TJ00_9AGAR|nr:hypothetical protein C8F04DRAFT_1174106 [Mycena alexandri]
MFFSMGILASEEERLPSGGRISEEMVSGADYLLKLTESGRVEYLSSCALGRADETREGGPGGSSSADSPSGPCQDDVRKTNARKQQEIGKPGWADGEGLEGLEVRFPMNSKITHKTSHGILQIRGILTAVWPAVFRVILLRKYHIWMVCGVLHRKERRVEPLTPAADRWSREGANSTEFIIRFLVLNSEQLKSEPGTCAVARMRMALNGTKSYRQEQCCEGQVSASRDVSSYSVQEAFWTEGLAVGGFWKGKLYQNNKHRAGGSKAEGRAGRRDPLRGSTASRQFTGGLVDIDC